MKNGLKWQRGERKGGRDRLGRGGVTDISHSRRDANLDARVSFLCQLTLEEFVQFGVEDAVGDELPTLGNGGSRYGSHDVLRLLGDIFWKMTERCCR